MDKNARKMSRMIKIICWVNLSICTLSADATVLQILHTNDSHSYLDSSTHEKNIGGVARLKSLIDFYKEKMRNEGVETLTLDAGDFTEGNVYFLADAGRKSFMAHNQLGYDAVTLGNHEWLIGDKDLNQILGEIDLKFSFLAANIDFLSNKSDCENIKKVIKPFEELKIAGLNIGVLGLTTNEAIYKWRFKCGKITNPLKSALHYEEILRLRNNDIIVALTHLGVNEDIQLAKKSKEIDLIVGGHSHSILSKPLIIKNINARSIPIVQAGYHTKYLGRMIIEFTKKKKLKILSYELIPVENIKKDYEMNRLVEDTELDLSTLYGVGWLDKIIGFSDLTIDSQDGQNKWGYFIADTIKEKSFAEIGIHSPLMNSESYPIGEISRKNLINSIPRIYNIHDRFGWSIYTTVIKGVWLQLALKSLMNPERPVVFSGISLKYIKGPFGIKIPILLINGKKINPFKDYSVALTEGVVIGAAGMSKYSSAILRFPKKSTYRIWSSLEEKLLKVGNTFSIKNISEENHFYFPTNH